MKVNDAKRMNPKRNMERLRKIVVKKALEGETIKEVAQKYMVSRKFVYRRLKRLKETLKVNER